MNQKPPVIVPLFVMPFTTEQVELVVRLCAQAHADGYAAGRAESQAENADEFHRGYDHAEAEFTVKLAAAQAEIERLKVELVWAKPLFSRRELEAKFAAAQAEIAQLRKSFDRTIDREDAKRKERDALEAELTDLRAAAERVCRTAETNEWGHASPAAVVNLRAQLRGSK